jgi:hypothetical protein
VSLCVLVGGHTTALAITAFTLSWQHSVEHTAWSEAWSVGPGGLKLEEARVKGSGAGMDPGPGARLEAGWWIWAPALPPVPDLELAASGATGGGWRLCHAGGCLTLGAEAGAPVRLAPCERAAFIENY